MRYIESVVTAHLMCLWAEYLRESEGSYCEASREDQIRIINLLCLVFGRYMPIIPIVLVNGCGGVGTRYSTFIPNYNPRDVVANVSHYLKYESMDPNHSMEPWYKGFQRSIKKMSDKGDSYTTTSEYQVEGRTIRVTELPVGTWTDNYKQSLERMKTDCGPFFEKILVHGDDRFVDFELQLSEENMMMVKQEGLEKKLKLTSIITTTNMRLLDENGEPKLYKSPKSITEDFINHILKYCENNIKTHQHF